MIFNADPRGGTKKRDTVHWINCARGYDDGLRTATRLQNYIIYKNYKHKVSTDHPLT